VFDDTSVPPFFCVHAGELLSAGLNTIGFSWIGSPAATELEVILLDQLASALGLPPRFLSPDAPPASPGRTGGGVIQCTASDAVLVALLAARARVREREGAGAGASPEAVYAVDARLVVYTSDQAHSCVVKAAMVAGVLRVRALPTTAGDGFALAPATLAAAVAADVDAGLLPTLVVATLGTTSTCAVDPVDELAAVAAAAGAWTHVDAAYAGVFMLAPSLRPAFAFAAVDSFSTNMHKSGMVSERTLRPG
jgi:glutamate/tyrosine decarboxylase-like PLP-dependent enzyme